MVARKPAVEETTTEEPDESKSATIADVKAVVSGFVDEIKAALGRDSRLAPEVENPTEVENETEDKLPSPRRVEVDTEKAVREALGGLTVNIHNSEKAEKTETKEPEQAPGGASKLSQFIWGKQNA
jgi:hypothetical protein